MALSADAEDALDERCVGLDEDPLLGDHLDHLPRDVGIHLDGDRRSTHDQLTSDLRDGFYVSLDGRSDLLLYQAEESAEVGDVLTLLDRVALLLQHVPLKVHGLYSHY